MTDWWYYQSIKMTSCYQFHDNIIVDSEHSTVKQSSSSPARGGESSKYVQMLFGYQYIASMLTLQPTAGGGE